MFKLVKSLLFLDFKWDRFHVPVSLLHSPAQYVSCGNLWNINSGLHSLFFLILFVGVCFFVFSCAHNMGWPLLCCMAIVRGDVSLWGPLVISKGILATLLSVDSPVSNHRGRQKSENITAGAQTLILVRNMERFWRWSWKNKEPQSGRAQRSTLLLAGEFLTVGRDLITL